MFAIATDLDRTLLPNGDQEYDGSLPIFKRILSKERPRLIYVTGRNLRLVREAIRKYGIPVPDHLVAEVGTALYRKSGGRLARDKGWFREVRSGTRGWDLRSFRKALDGLEGLDPQESEFQNRFKLSYYIRDPEGSRRLVTEVGKIVRGICRDAETVYSVDETRGLGLLDILPKRATKLAGLDFIRKGLGLRKSRVIYCGDSGNDLLPLTAGYPSVLVRNAIPSVRRQARKVAGPGKLYAARGAGNLNGYYVSGIIEGLVHFGFIGKEWLSQEA